jgi:hypothetical protein
LNQERKTACDKYFALFEKSKKQLHSNPAKRTCSEELESATPEVCRIQHEFVQILSKFDHELLTKIKQQILEIEKQRQAVGESLVQYAGNPAKLLEHQAKDQELLAA